MACTPAFEHVTVSYWYSRTNLYGSIAGSISTLQGIWCRHICHSIRACISIVVNGVGSSDYFTCTNKVNDVINGRTIAGYKLPDSFVKEVDGKKQTLTPTDFYNYLSRQTEFDADGNRITGYQKDLANESDDDYLARELITAWLMFTGGTYKDLANMAIKENEVRTLKLKSKENRAHKTVKVTKPNSKYSTDDIVLG